MLPKEQVLRALGRGEPDAVPIGEFIIDEAVIRGFGKGYEDVVDFALGEGLGLVGAVANFATVRTLPDGCFIDEWGCTYRKGREFISHPIKGPIATEKDLDSYRFPDPQASHRLGTFPALAAKARGRLALNFHSRVDFMWSVYLMGMDEMLAVMALNPGFAHRLFDRVADVNIEVIRRAVRAGADTVSLGDDYCSNQGPLMSPAMFREFLLPNLRRAVDAIHEEGARCIKHCDGNLWPILDDLVAAGIDCINPLEPVANMDMGEVKRRFGDRVSIMGNIDCGALLCNGTESEVEAAVRKCIKAGAPGGGLIVSSSNSIHSGVKPSNYAAMIKTVHAAGRYPIR